MLIISAVLTILLNIIFPIFRDAKGESLIFLVLSPRVTKIAQSH
jgi:hypothetical protein